MVALPARSVFPLRSSSAAVFGGPIDISLLFLSSRHSVPVLCSGCQTLNRRSAKLCKGCAGKLPAYYTADGGEAALTPAASESRQDVARPSRLFRGAWASATAIALLFALIWWGDRHASTRYADATSTERATGAPHALSDPLVPLQIGGLSFADARPVSIVAFAYELAD